MDDIRLSELREVYKDRNLMEELEWGKYAYHGGYRSEQTGQFINWLCDAAHRALKPKTGKWIYCEDEAEEYVDGYRCDQCGFFVPWDYKHKSPYFIEEYLYCPSCSARMKGGE